MFLVVGITGKVGGATATHLLAQGKKVRALVRDRAKAASWADQGVELVDGDWNDTAAIERALDGVDGAFVMLPAVWAPSPDFKEAKGVIANYVEALTKAAPPRVVALSSMGANRTSGLGMITALSLLEQGFRDLASPVAVVSFQSPSTSSTPWAIQSAAFSRLRTSARTLLPWANRCLAVAPPTFPVTPITRNMRILPVLNGLRSRVGLT